MEPDISLYKLLNFDKITFASNVVKEFADCNGEDVEGAKFKIGQWVVIMKGGVIIATGVVIGVSANDDRFEYAVSSYGYLVWEDEMHEKDCE